MIENPFMSIERNWLKCESCGKQQLVWLPNGHLCCAICGHEQKRCVGEIWLQGEVCEGGGSVVYRGFDQVMERYVAVKIGGSYEECLAEARLLARFDRDTIVRVWGVGEMETGVGYLSLSWLEGTHLEHFLDENGAFAEREACEIFEKLWSAVHAVHQQRMLHRDLKPGNVMYEAQEKRVTLIDFGRSQWMNGDSKYEEMIWVTPFYAAPEAILGEAEEIRSDYYALGATLHHMLTGRLPIEVLPDSSVEQILEQKKNIAPVRELVPELSSAMGDLVAGLMAYDVNLRFANAERVQNALERVKRNLIVAGAVKDGGSRKMGGWQQMLREKFSWRVGLGGAAALLLVGGLFAWARKGEKKQEPPVVVKNQPETPKDDPWLNLQTAAVKGDLFAWKMALGKIQDVSKLTEEQADEVVLSRVIAENFLGNEASQKAAIEAAVKYFHDTKRPRMMAWLAGDVEMNQALPGLSALRDAGLAWAGGDFAMALAKMETLPKVEFGREENWARGLDKLLAPVVDDAKLVVESHLEEQPSEEAAREEKLEQLKTARLALNTDGVAVRKFDEAIQKLSAPPEPIAEEEPKSPETAEQGEKTPEEPQQGETPEVVKEPETTTPAAPVVSLAERAKEYEHFLKEGQLEGWLQGWASFSPTQAQNEAYLGRKDLVTDAAAFFFDLTADLTGRPVVLPMHLKDQSTWERLVVDREGKIWVGANNRPNRQVMWADFVENDLITLYQFLLKRLPSSGENALSEGQILERHVHAVAFDWLMGDKERAGKAMQVLGEKHMELVEKWRLWKLPLEESQGGN